MEDRRERDVKAKFAHQLADVDLLIVHRPTLFNAITAEGFWPPLHGLATEHVEVIKDFMKSGKPVLACLGPPSWMNGADPQAADGFERLIAERGSNSAATPSSSTASARLRGACPGGLVGAAGPTCPAGRRREDWRCREAPTRIRLAPRSNSPRGAWIKTDPRLAPAARLPRAGVAESPLVRGRVRVHVARSRGTRRSRSQRDEEGDVSAVPRYEPTTRADKKWNTRQAERHGPFPGRRRDRGKVPAAWMNEDLRSRPVRGRRA